MINHFRAALALVCVTAALITATGCHKQDPATAESRDSSVDKQTAAQSVQNNPNIPPEAKGMIMQRMPQQSGYSGGPKK